MNVLEILGSVIEGKYRIESPIGSGGFGTVFRSRHLGHGHPVAVKLLTHGSERPTNEALDKFRQEAASAFRLKHPNVVTVYDFGITAEGLAYLVMELLEGQPVSREIQAKGKLSPRRCAEILIPVCEVLAEAHSEGIIHRDIKPENIFLNRTRLGEQVKVVDFGIAKLTDHTLSFGNEPETSLVGTPAYMSPERLQNRPYDGRTDVYSLGITLFQMLTGRVPFKATDASNIAALLLMQVNSEPPNLRQFGVEVHEELEELVRSALEKDPARRPHADEFGKKLGKITGIGMTRFNRAVSATPVSAPRPTPAGVPAPTKLHSTTGTNGFISPTSTTVSNTPPVPIRLDEPLHKERTDETRAIETRPMESDSPPPNSTGSSLKNRGTAVAATSLGAILLVGSGLGIRKTYFSEKTPTPPATVSIPPPISPPHETAAVETPPSKPARQDEVRRKPEAKAKNEPKPVRKEASGSASGKPAGSKPPPGVPAELWRGKGSKP